MALEVTFRSLPPCLRAIVHYYTMHCGPSHHLITKRRQGSGMIGPENKDASVD